MAERGIDHWVGLFTREEMPLFSRTVKRVAGKANQDNCSISDLAWSILEDPTLTSRVLKLANSVHFNPSSQRIRTVSRAVMRLGTNTIKEICLAISLIETVVRGLNKERVAVEVARSFHAAVQARKMAVTMNLSDSEEVFIAALLARIGNIAFWCFADDLGPQLEEAMLESESEEQAELKVLGFKLARLTERLSQEWKLSDLLEHALRDKSVTDPRVRSIKLSCEVAESSEKGWDSPEAEKTIKKVSGHFHRSEKETTEILHESARAAAEVSGAYGSDIISRLVPVPEEPSSEKPDETQMNGQTNGQPATTKGQGEAQYPKPDLSILLSSLRDLSSLITSGGGELNMVLSIVLEGIYRGIGMDRVVFGLISSNRKQLKGKYGLGCLEDGWVENFTVSLNSDEQNVFGYVLKSKKSLWVTEKPDASIKPFLTEELSNVIGVGPYFAIPVSIKDVAIGVIYADRKPSGRKLDEESFENFTFFGQQTNMSLNALA